MKIQKCTKKVVAKVVIWGEDERRHAVMILHWGTDPALVPVMWYSPFKIICSPLICQTIILIPK